MERLETRLTPACLTTLAIDGSLLIEGDFLPNDIVVYDDGLGNLEVECDGEVAFFGGVDVVDIYAGGGADLVDYILDGDLERPLDLYIDLGSGRDDSILDFSDFGRLNILADLSIQLLGKSGADQVTLALGYTESAVVTAAFNLGRGHDIFGAFLDADQIDSDVALVVDGGAGHDDIAVVTQDGDGEPIVIDADGLLAIDIDGGKGRDTVYVDLFLLADSPAAVDALVTGGAGDDDLTLLVSDDNSDPWDGDLVGDVIGDGGNDLCEALDNVVVDCEELV